MRRGGAKRRQHAQRAYPRRFVGDQYQKITEEYGKSQVIHFSYGADGCVNEIEF